MLVNPSGSNATRTRSRRVATCKNEPDVPSFISSRRVVSRTLVFALRHEIRQVLGRREERTERSLELLVSLAKPPILRLERAVEGGRNSRRRRGGGGSGGGGGNRRRGRDRSSNGIGRGLRGRCLHRGGRGFGGDRRRFAGDLLGEFVKRRAASGRLRVVQSHRLLNGVHRAQVVTQMDHHISSHRCLPNVACGANTFRHFVSSIFGLRGAVLLRRDARRRARRERVERFPSSSRLGVVQANRLRKGAHLAEVPPLAGVANHHGIRSLLDLPDADHTRNGAYGKGVVVQRHSGLEPTGRRPRALRATRERWAELRVSRLTLARSGRARPRALFAPILVLVGRVLARGTVSSGFPRVAFVGGTREEPPNLLLQADALLLARGRRRGRVRLLLLHRHETHAIRRRSRAPVTHTARADPFRVVARTAFRNERGRFSRTRRRTQRMIPLHPHATPLAPGSFARPSRVHLLRPYCAASYALCCCRMNPLM